jgi:hypothetical protein
MSGPLTVGASDIPEPGVVALAVFLGFLAVAYGGCRSLHRAANRDNKMQGV